ncbi:MAG TPA: hypothetical protein VHC70_02495 [Phycisphaerales bacterium]|nr:hypothetical protein [Phycisphaerales bacterium]
MHRSERFVAYAALAVALMAVVGQSAGLRFGSVATASPRAATAPAPAPEAAKIATCDIYSLVQVMVAGDQYKPAQAIEQERIKARLAPMEEELRTIDQKNTKLREELTGADSQDPTVKEKLKEYNASAQEFESKLQPYNQLKGELAAGYSAFVVGQFYDAYQKVTAEAKRLATAGGYTYIIAQKKGDMSGAREPNQLVEDFLARPVVMAPADADLTEAVRLSMKLPETIGGPSVLPEGPSAPPSPPGAAGPASEPPRK